MAKRHYHILTCRSPEDLQRFINIGWFGAGPVVGGSGWRDIRMNWDMLADLARVQSGDYIILHSKGDLVGVFQAATPFLICNDAVQFFNGPMLTRENWEKHGPITEPDDYAWWCQLQDSGSFFPIPAPADHLFSSIAHGEIYSLPERLRYEDKNKTVKGLHEYDFSKLFDILLSENSNGPIPYKPNNKPPCKMVELSLVPTPEFYEKNLEALLVKELRTNAQRFSTDIGKIDNVLNTVPLGYLGMADLVTWAKLKDPLSVEHVFNFAVWELKRAPLTPNLVKDIALKLVKYLREAEYLFPSIIDFPTILRGVILGGRSDYSSQDWENALPTGVSPNQFLIIGYSIGRRGLRLDKLFPSGPSPNVSR